MKRVFPVGPNAKSPADTDASIALACVALHKAFASNIRANCGMDCNLNELAADCTKCMKHILKSMTDSKMWSEKTRWIFARFLLRHFLFKGPGTTGKQLSDVEKSVWDAALEQWKEKYSANSEVDKNVWKMATSRWPWTILCQVVEDKQAIEKVIWHWDAVCADNNSDVPGTSTADDHLALTVSKGFSNMDARVHDNVLATLKKNYKLVPLHQDTAPPKQHPSPALSRKVHFLIFQQNPKDKVFPSKIEIMCYYAKSFQNPK